MEQNKKMKDENFMEGDVVFHCKLSGLTDNIYFAVANLFCVKS